MKKSFYDCIEEIIQEDGRYHPDAYVFVLDALHYTQRKIKQSRHVSGEELLEGMKQYVVKEFGPLGITVLEHWGIKSTDDFGHLVFNLVAAGVLRKQEDDRFESFHDRFDFEQVFKKDYRKQLEKRISRMR